MTTPLAARNHDFICCCRRRSAALQAAGIIPDLDTIITDVLAAEAPSYYIDYEYACRLIRDIELHGLDATDSDTDPCDRARLLDLWRDYSILRARRPADDYRDIVTDLLDGDDSHPRFYLTRRRARFILRTENHRLRQNLKPKP